ncbi:MAG TPA: tripartite tricarboxylate transporter substrate binding protein [Ramlibacter sp.]|jgi:tripartite-type tricarboxylate transporter receptor subunit TctC|nr:tripartite tricarboxylate transporter substrate binding protein [Ramlibacter sp.]
MILKHCLFALGLLTAAASTFAQGYPNRAVTLVVGFTPGGGSDTVARVIAPALSAELKVPVLVENKVGAGGAIATDFIAKSKPDGYTMLVASPGAYTIAVSLRKLPYDPIKDFTPIAQLTSYPNILVVNAGSGINSVADLVKQAKANPGKLNFASTGAGTTTHLAFAHMAMMTGIDLGHVPYKGNPQAMNDLLGGQVQLFIGDPPPLLGHIESGRLKALAVTTRNRFKQFPNIPSMSEAGVAGYDVPFWHGIMAPQGLPADVAARWDEVLARVMARKDVIEKIEAAGMGVEYRPGAQLARQIVDETARWAHVIKSNNIKE